MELIKKMMRGVGRITVFCLLALLLIISWSSSESLHKIYMNKYDTFRRMLHHLRLVSMPPARNIEGLFDYFFWVDFVWSSVSALLILIGQRLGGWMLAYKYSFKLLICYLPHLLRIPKQPFPINDRLQLMRLIAILGVSFALAAKFQQNSLQCLPEPIKDKEITVQKTQA